MGLDFENADGTGATGQEKVDHLVISGIENGIKIYSGDTLVFTGDGNKDFDTNMPEAGAALTTAEIKALTILPTQDFSGTIDIGVKVYSKDFDDDTSGSGQVTTQNPTEVTHTITVNGVVDTSETAGAQLWTEGNNEVGNSGHLYVKINSTEVDGDPGDETIFTTDEDKAVGLGMDWKSFEDIAPHSTTSDNSETAEFIIRNQSGDTTSFTLHPQPEWRYHILYSGGWYWRECQCHRHPGFWWLEADSCRIAECPCQGPEGLLR
ncbi:MAG: hypothetical protein CSB48_01055 [Proteobacteria bacterium]|nr:MAG: hypothetical protein CSB48_01055 [Pseudomonadota bacterium]